LYIILLDSCLDETNWIKIINSVVIWANIRKTKIVTKALDWRQLKSFFVYLPHNSRIMKRKYWIKNLRFDFCVLVFDARNWYPNKKIPFIKDCNWLKKTIKIVYFEKMLVKFDLYQFLEEITFLELKVWCTVACKTI